MPAGKKRNFPAPGTHPKCRECEISLVCISGRRRFRHRYWCKTCQGVYYESIDKIVRCVVFRNKRGRYKGKERCPACVHPEDMGLLGRRNRRPGHGKAVTGLTHRDAQAWREETKT